MGFNMERIRVTNKKKNPKNFFAANGVEITLEEGDNFVNAEDLQHLLEHSDGFKHFVETKVLVVRDDKRKETEEEKAERKNLLQKAKAMFKNAMPGKANKAQTLDMFQQSPVLDLSASTEAFDKSIADSSAKKLAEFNGKAQELADHAAESLSKLKTTLRESFVNELEELSKISVEGFQTELDSMIEKNLDTFREGCAKIAAEMTGLIEKPPQSAKKSGKGSKS